MATTQETKRGRGRPRKPPLTLDGPIPEYTGITAALSLVVKRIDAPISFRWFKSKAEDPTSGMPVYRFGDGPLLFKWPELEAWALANIKRVSHG